MILNLSNFIHSLLLENETVIIPGFGAFISIYKPAEISENEIKPPSKEISFTQQIKNNDGLLVEIIARKAKISQTNALKRVEKARENMLYELDKGETVILENIGSLSYSENNEIEFTPFHEDNLLLDSFGLESISKEDSVKNLIESDSIKDAENKDVQPLAGAALVGQTKKSKDDEPDSVDHEEKEEPVIDLEGGNTNKVEKETETIQEPEPEKFQFPEYKPAPPIEKDEKRKKIGWYWYLLILIPFIVGGYFIIANYSKSEKTEIAEEQNTKIDRQENQIQTPPPADSIQNDSVKLVETDTQSEQEQEQAIQTDNSKYYLIGGGFREQENVDNYILELKEKGIESFIAV
ncbi:MAG TPA: hypothetical protein VLA03_06090, partial [Draconibacterium sp.]|nr:hypothetical protein [Draconibacterium sp.]